MTIGSVNSNSALTSALQAQGLSSDKINLVETDLQQVEQSGGTSGSSGSTGVDSSAVRAALDKKLSDDVSSGKLSQDDADKIGKALDQMDGTASGTTSSSSGSAGAGKAGGGAPAGGGGGGGGGGGSSEKTELSRTVTVSGGIKTTVIKYTDGTSETKTSVDVSDKDTSAKNKVDDKSKTDHAAKANGTAKTDASGKSNDSTATGASSDEQAAQDYLSKIEPGSLFEAYA